MLAAPTSVEIRTVADLIARLGDIAPNRIRLHPAPGTATKADLVKLDGQGERMLELIDGVFVEKAMGARASLIAIVIAGLLHDFVRRNNFGIVLGEGGMLEILEGLVCIPDVAFISWERIPGGVVPDEPVPELSPDLAVEVLSRSNTAREMERKRREYFQSGVRLVWLVDPVARTIRVYSSEDSFIELTSSQMLDGGDVLPGFAVAVSDVFAELDRRAK